MPSATWALMKYNTSSYVWANMWAVYVSEFKFLENVEHKYKINPDQIEKFVSKTCGYSTYIDADGKTQEKY